MVRKSFGRSLSFPIPSSIPAAHKIKGRGSTSLPCRFHPFISRLQDEIQDLLTWQSEARPGPAPPPPAWIGDGLARLDRLHSSLDDLLQHPQAQDPLRRQSPWTGRVLDDFLRFADAYGSLRSAIVALNDRQAETQAAVRRNDESRISSCARSQRKAEKELLRIAAAVRGAAGRWGPAASVPEDEDTAEAELAAVMREVAAATASASAAVIAGIAEVSAGSAPGVTSLGAGLCSSLKGSTCMVGSMLIRLGSVKRNNNNNNNKEKGGEEKKDAEDTWRVEALERLEALEICIGEVEKMSERLFRSLVNTRVFLLNILTPSL